MLIVSPWRSEILVDHLGRVVTLWGLQSDFWSFGDQVCQSNPSTAAEYRHNADLQTTVR